MKLNVRIMQKMRSYLLLFLAILWVSAASAQGCDIVYGSNWAFLSASPPGWSSSCGSMALEGTVFTLTPTDLPKTQLDGLIYVTVSKKGFPTLHQFAVDEQERFKAESSALVVESIAKDQALGKTIRELVHVSGASDGREELVCYVEGPTAYYIIVLTAKSGVELNKYRGAFQAYIDSFVTMSKE